MARPEAVAVGGYYKTPVAVVEQIAALFRPLPPEARKSGASYALVDPCAGDGEALTLLGETLLPRVDYAAPSAVYYGVELEGERHAALQSRLHKVTGLLVGDKALHGDAFQVTWETEAADVLYLNPPYDIDRETGRLEHRFLERFTRVLRPGHGLLIYIVPHYALEASAAYLAEHYEDVRCWRFPPAEYQAFRQVVLVGRRRAAPRRFPDEAAAARVRDWAAAPETLPGLHEAAPCLSLPATGAGWMGLGLWQMNAVDVRALYDAGAALLEGRAGKLVPVRGLGLEAGLGDLISHRFPLVMPPRPAHVAIALAAGLVNGHRILPDEPAAGLPPLMVKGVFHKEYQVVDEKRNKEGEVTSQVAIQQPRLTVSILDMRTWTYHDLADGAVASGATAVAEFNVADLLENYGRSPASLMRRQCPPLHDPANPAQLVPLPPMAVRPFPYQAHGISAALKVIFAEEPPFAGEHPFILGEVGTGKTLVAFGTALALAPAHLEATRVALGDMGAGASRRVRPVRRLLVMCPPHLVASWAAEAAKCIPGARVVVLERIADVRAALRLPDAPPRDLPGDGLTLFLLSREYAKLGHTWRDGRAGGRCPRCGATVEGSETDVAAARLVCDHRERRPANAAARWAERLALALAPVLPEDPDVQHLAHGRQVKAQRVKWAAKWRAADPADVDAARQVLWNRRDAVVRQYAAEVYAALVAHCAAGEWVEARKTADRLALALWATDAASWPERETAIVGMVDGIMAAAAEREDVDIYNAALKLLLSLAPGGAAQRESIARHTRQVRQVAAVELERFRGYIKKFLAQREGTWSASSHDAWRVSDYEWADGRAARHVGYGKPVIPQGSPAAAVALMETLVKDGEWHWGEPCGERVYQAQPAPARFPLATYISRYARDLFDLLVLDEAHEYSTDGSAQERAAHRLTALGKPTLVLTGTSNNGYASSLFMNMWALSRRFRAEFGREEIEQFVNRYGYRKVKIDPREGEDVQWFNRYGAMSDRVDTGASMRLRKIGQAPGVLPLFVLRHMLPSAILLQKSDMSEELPPLIEIGQAIEPAAPLHHEYLGLRQRLIARIMDDLRTKSDRAGLLWGQMAQMPSYLDRAHGDTGNADAPEGGRRYEIRYPASAGGELVAAATPLDAAEMAAKETWLLDTLAAEFAEGRPCLVFVVNTRSGLAERVLRLVEQRFGAGTATLLLADKVPAGKRMAWIDREVVRRGRRALIVNPEAVETGLNNLVYFATAVWFQNPNCSSVTYTQANGRIHRPGQKRPCRVYVPYYSASTQETQFVLLGHKVAAARQTDGLDVTSALLAAGVGENEAAAAAAMSVGQAIYRKLQEGVGTGRSSANGHGRPVWATATPPATRLAEGETDERPGYYYVSVIDGRRWLLLYGPFDTHAAALAAVEMVRRLAVDVDPRAWFYAFGTARLDPDGPGPVPPGVLNSLLPPIGADASATEDHHASLD